MVCSCICATDTYNLASKSPGMQIQVQVKVDPVEGRVTPL
jgi:hypothetical protein